MDNICIQKQHNGKYQIIYIDLGSGFMLLCAHLVCHLVLAGKRLDCMDQYSVYDARELLKQGHNTTTMVESKRNINPNLDLECQMQMMLKVHSNS